MFKAVCRGEQHTLRDI